MNMNFFRLINDLANRNIVMDKIMIFFSKDVPYVFMVITAIIFFIGIINKKDEYRKIAFNTFLITLINLIISFIIGNIYYVNRPFVNNKVNLLMPHPADASFPSDHATGTMSIALGLSRYNKLLSILLMILSLIVGFSRVYVGHHYPLDIIGAYIIVAATGYIYDLKLRTKVNMLYDVVEKKIVEKFGLEKLYN